MHMMGWLPESFMFDGRTQRIREGIWILVSTEQREGK